MRYWNRALIFSTFLLGGLSIDTYAAENGCKYDYKKAKNLEPYDLSSVEVFARSAPSKGQFEKTDEYNKRVALERKLSYEKADGEVKAFTNGGVVAIRYKVESYFIKYNADTEVLKLDFPIGHKQFKDFKEYKDKYSAVSNTLSTKRTRGLTTTMETSSTSFGVAYRNKFNMLSKERSNISIKLPPQQAKKSVENLQVVFLGTLERPYRVTDYLTYQDSENFEQTKHRSEYMVMDVVCAAVVNMETNQVLLEIK